ncbi:hypothetical protein BJV82DRAFT_7581 [Fennellomyces sp. T-0311]|nr:hypothetical protein BJV82DRAFT_7581 [Fennellomyces sp. T-0311]
MHPLTAFAASRHRQQSAGSTVDNPDDKDPRDTSGITDLLVKQVALLDVQVSENTRNFNSKIRKAKQMIQLVPSLPDGYMRAGELYSTHGYQRRAMAIYKQGLGNVGNKHQHLLRQQYEAAKEKHELRIDIPGLAPYDVITCIAEFLTDEDRLVLLDVSKTWRLNFSQCPSIWSAIHVDAHQQVYAVQDISRLAHHVGSYILDFTLHKTRKHYSDALFRGMIDGCFHNLAHLALYYCTIHSNAKLLTALGHVSRTLKKLDIIMIDDVVTALGESPTVPYKQILSICQQLEYFRYEHYVGSISNDQAGSLTPGYTSKLTEFYLKCPHTVLENIADILGSCPELRYLQLVNCTSAIVDVAVANCSKLESIILKDDSKYIIDHAWIKENRSSHHSGVNTVAAIIDDPRSFAKLFAKHSNTMEGLSLSILAPVVNRWMSFIDAFDHLPNLVYLELQCKDTRSCTAAAALLRKSPALLRLCFSPGTKFSGTHLVWAIINLPHLRELDISNTEASEQDLRALFQGLAGDDTRQSTLQRVGLSYIYDDFAIDCVLDSLPNIAALQRIEIIYCSLVTEPMINMFCERMQAHPSIEAITFEDLQCVTDDTLKYLVAIKGLERLKLNFLKDITEQGIEVFDGSSIKLEILGSGDIPDTTWN